MTNGPSLVVKKDVEFTWHAGLSLQQKRQCIRSLHEAARETCKLRKLLEISSKSEEPLGVQLSAFQLCLPRGGHGERSAPVEVLFQGSKVFSQGGPFTELYDVDPRMAKKDQRLRSSGDLVRFDYFGEIWQPEPRTAFYDWLYLKALQAHPQLAEQLRSYDAFTDIEFNPKKSFNCQAYSAALHVALVGRGRIGEALASREAFLEFAYGPSPAPKPPRQLHMDPTRNVW